MTTYHCPKCEEAYKTLQLPYGASKQEIRVARLEVAKAFHPDKWQDKPGARFAEDLLKKVNEAADHLNEHGSTQNCSTSSAASQDVAETVSQDVAATMQEIADKVIAAMVAEGYAPGEIIEALFQIATEAGFTAEEADEIISAAMKRNLNEHVTATEDSEDQVRDAAYASESPGFDNEFDESRVAARPGETINIHVEGLPRADEVKWLRSGWLKRGTGYYKIGTHTVGFTPFTGFYTNLVHDGYFVGNGDIIATLKIARDDFPETYPKWWRVSRMAFRIVSRLFLTCLGIAVGALIATVLLAGIVAYLTDYWQRNAEKKTPATSQSWGWIGGTLGTLEAITLIPRAIWGGIVFFISPIVLAIGMLGAHSAHYFYAHQAEFIRVGFLALLGLFSVTIWKEYQFEFHTPVRPFIPGERKPASWQLGAAVMVLLAFAPIFITLLPRKVATPALPYAVAPAVNKPSIGSAAHRGAQTAKSDSEVGSFTGTFTNGKVLKAIYGNYDPSTASSSVVLPRRTETQNAGATSERRTGHASVILDAALPHAKMHQRLVVTATRVTGESCVACGARIGAYLYAESSGEWIVEVASSKALVYGSFGKAIDSPSDISLVDFGHDLYGFSLKGWYGGQGFESRDLTLVAPVDNQYRPVLSIKIAGNDSGACGVTVNNRVIPCYRNSTSIRFVNRGQVFDDIVASRTGTRLPDDSESVISADHKDLYVFDGRKYEPQGIKVLGNSLSSPEGNAVDTTQEQPAGSAGRSRALNRDGLVALAKPHPDLVTAKQDFESAFRADNSNIEALNNLGWIDGRMGNYSRAKTVLEKVLSLAPTRRVAQINLGYVLAKLGNVTEASSHFCRYLALSSSQSAARKTLLEENRDPDPNVHVAVAQALRDCGP